MMNFENEAACSSGFIYLKNRFYFQKAGTTIEADVILMIFIMKSDDVRQNYLHNTEIVL